MQTPEKTKVRRSEKFKSKFLISAVRSLGNLRIGLRRRLKDRNDVPAETRGDWPRISWSSKKRTNLLFFSPTNERCLPAPSVINSEEREFVEDSVASKHMLSRKDLNSAELETARVSKSPTTVVAANGEVQTKEEATVHVKEMDLGMTAKFLEDTPAVLSLGKLCDDRGYSQGWTSGQKPQLIKDGSRIKCSTENYVPIVVPSSSTGSSSSAAPPSPTSVPQEAVIPTLPPASTGRHFAWTSRIQKTPTKVTTTRPYGETCCMICKTGSKNLQRIWWMRVFQLLGTHPRVLLVNQLQSREEKWYRASTVFILTSQRTEIATSARGPRKQ